MVTIHVPIPEQLNEFITDQLTEGGYGSAGEYVQTLIREAHERKTQERLEALLLEGLASGPATPFTPEDWNDIQREVHARRSTQPETGTSYSINSR